MSYINPSFTELKPYLELIVQQGAAALRPFRCTSCGKGRVWCHGSYQRKVKEGIQGAEFLNPFHVPIFRYFCNFCKHSFSVLPKRMKRQSKLQAAKHWIQNYTGKNIVKSYRKWFGGDLVCAVKELKIGCVKLDERYVSPALRRLEQLIVARQKKV